MKRLIVTAAIGMCLWASPSRASWTREMSETSFSAEKSPLDSRLGTILPMVLVAAAVVGLAWAGLRRRAI